MNLRPETVLTLVFAIALLLGCSSAEKLVTNTPSNTTTVSNKNTSAKVEDSEDAEPNEDGTIPSGTGVEKEKPAAGKGNVQGKAFFNEKPAAGVDVKLCKTFNQFFGGCSGDTFTAKTDDNGEYVIKNVPPGVYEGLTVKVFNTPYYVFATSGIISAAKYNIEADKTYFAPDTNLFKNDLKLVNPRAGSKIAGEGIEVKWEAYPDAAYYKFSIHADSSGGGETVYDYINKRVEDVSFVLDKPLKPGSYTCEVEAYNANDKKLATSADDIKFTVK
ncbi:MAG TPA: carboxypeptidase-like regulatory domain-containing protein [Pyrinomonadaceae bacterium]|nr:carboxypeptidase-like regulatory domain-containing protein [Pyrinomonadaceae bacterium]